MAKTQDIYLSFLKDHLADLAMVAEALASNLIKLSFCYDKKVTIQGDIVSGGYIQTGQETSGIYAPTPAESWQQLTPIDSDRANLLLQHLQDKGKFPVSDWSKVSVEDVNSDMITELKNIGLSHGALLLDSHCDICRDWH